MHGCRVVEISGDDTSFLVRLAQQRCRVAETQLALRPAEPACRT
jgi:hypothetical protein